MEKIGILRNIVLLPKKIQDGNKSIYELLKESGYMTYFNKISEDDFLEILRDGPNFVNDWLRYSENKRVSSGYFFTETDGIYSVGFLSLNDGANEKLFSSREEACAYFIKKEIDEILALSNS